MGDNQTIDLKKIKDYFVRYQMNSPGFFKKFINFFTGLFNKANKIYSYIDLIDNVLTENKENRLSAK